MKKKLRDIATIRMGQSLREAPESAESGKCRLLRMRDVAEDGSIEWDSLMRVDLDIITKEERFLRKGDIVFKAKGFSMYAVVIDRDESNVLATAPFVIIRAASEVLPEFLAWQINQRRVQQQLARRTLGAALPFVSTSVLASLKIALPEIDVQRKIAMLDKLAKREKQLSERLSEKRSQLIKYAANEMLRQSI